VVGYPLGFLQRSLKGIKMSEEKPNSIVKEVSVSLTPLKWHMLLKELDMVRSIANRDTTHAIELWEEISTQLDGKEHIIQGSAKHRRMYPDAFKEQQEEEFDSFFLEAAKIYNTFPWYRKLLTGEVDIRIALKQNKEDRYFVRPNWMVKYYEKNHQANK
jgi:hypothetical protein